MPGKHARAPAGPVTTVLYAVTTKPQTKPTSVLLYIWPAIPVAALILPALRGHLLSYADAALGYDATLCLVACMLITPVTTVAKLSIIKLRWWYGMLVFYIAVAAIIIHLAYPPGTIATRVAGNVTDWTGTLILALLTPMALTSCKTAQKLLGPEWKKWQRNLMWFVWGIVGVHLYTTHAWLVVVAYMMATVPTFVFRMPKIRKALKTWRAGGYSTGGWWTILVTLAVIFAVGVAILLGEEVQTVARALTSA
jgi:DMSO/TMAO reductase YedYZ heme-binding membrane subunit